MRDFLAAVWGTKFPYGELRLIRPGRTGSMQHYFDVAHIDVLEAQARTADNEGWDVYYGVLPRTNTGHRDPDGRLRGGTDADTPGSSDVLWQDIDLKRIEGGHVAALLQLQRAGIDPSIIVDSGNGLHAYWLLREPVPFAGAKAVMQGMAPVVGGDHTWNASRVLRLPGTRNHKACYDHSDGGCAGKPVRLLHFAPRKTYRFSDFDSFLPMQQAPTVRVVERLESGWEPSSPSAAPFGEGARNNGLTRLAGAMVARGLTGGELLAALALENMQRCNPPLPQAEVEAIARSAIRWQ